MKSNKLKRINLTAALGVALLLTFLLLLSWGLYLVRDKLLRNANELGTHLAQSYATEEENRMNVYRMLLNLSSIYINQQIDTGTSPEELHQWMAEFSDHIAQTLDFTIIDPYAVIDGQIVAAVPRTREDNYDYAGTQWYSQALEADGEIIFTNAYQDAITGKSLITMAKKLHGENNVLCFDILLENFHAHKNKASIPDQSSYLLYDGGGNLIYATSSRIDVDSPQSQEYARKLLQAIQDGNLQSYSSSIRDLDGNQRGVYYYLMDNGWMSVITIPIQNILQDGWDEVVVILGVICAGLLLSMAWVLLYGYLRDRKMLHIADTLQILGDTFYAIYRVDYKTGLYETIKSSPDVADSLKKHGTFDDLMEVMEKFVEPKTFQEFRESFSPQNIQHLVEEGIFEFGGDYRRRFGEEYRWVSVRAIYNQGLDINEVILCFRDIHREKQIQLQQQQLLENALATARQNAHKKSAFFSNASHDMRTPLNAIIGLAGLAHNTDSADKKEEYVQKIEQAGRQMLTLVNDLLDMSHIEYSENTVLDYSPMSLKQCILDCAALFEDQAHSQHKTFTVRTEPEDLIVYCDQFRMNQILNNLLSNAFKYSLEGAEITLELKLTSRMEKMCKYQIVVSDTGIGMSEEFLERIFEPFSRETSFSPIRVSGTGLGMPIVKSLVVQMSGEITVESKLGKGSVFTVTLPLQLADQQLADQQLPDPQPVNPQLSPEDLTGRRILVAEDNEINMEIVTEYLSMLGAQVFPAWNGREAVDVFSTLLPGSVDAILMDMQMPEMDGCEACRAIRALDRPDAQTVPIIAVTANAFAEDIAKTTQAGMNAHVSKPIDFGQLVQVLHQYFPSA